MNTKRCVQAAVAGFLAAATAPTLILESLAQGTTAGSGAPPQAPSFLKQAGQKIFENAQKKVLHGLNEKLQTPQGQAATPPNGMPPLAPGTAGGASVSPSAAGTAVPGTAAPGTLQVTAPGTLPGPAPAAVQGTSPGTATTAPVAPVGAGSTVTTTAPARQLAPCRSWVDPSDRPIACLLCIHGLGLQSNSYEFFAKETSKKGLAVYAIDVRGFGTWMKSNGKGKVNFDDCLADIKQTLESIKSANPGVPVYILGESMGGAIALRAASMYPELIDGLISSVPAGERFQQEKTSAKVFLNLLSGMNLADVGGDIVNQATKNAKLATQWKDDPLARLNLSPQELIQFQDFMNFNHEAAKKVSQMPVLFVQGIGDQLVKPEGTWQLFNSIASKDKSFFAMPGEHLIFEEAQTQDAGPRDQNFRVISAWLTNKVGRKRRYSNQTAGTNGGDNFGYGGGIGYGGNGGGYGGNGGGYGGNGGGYGGNGGGYGGNGGGYGGNGGGYGGNGGGYGGNGGGYGGNLLSFQGLEGPTRMIDSGRFSDAIAELEKIKSQRPGDPQVLMLLGKAYSMSGDRFQAASYFRSAMRLNRGGGDRAKAFNSYMLGLEPSTGNGGNNAMRGGYGASSGPVAFGQKGTVYAFYANWADQCKNINDQLRQLTAAYGQRINVTPVNIEDRASDSLVDKYNIGPIPTVVFVDGSGQVSSTIIGESSLANYEKAVKNILNIR